MDWNDPDELRRLRDLLAADPRPAGDDPGARRARHRHAWRCSSGGSGMPEIGGSYFTFSNENNDLIWGFLKECPPPRLALQGPRHDAVVRPLRHRASPRWR